MADFTTLKMQGNTGASDASPTWTDVLFGTAANELRMCGSGAGAGNILAVNWPMFLRPNAVGVIPECWLYTVDGSGGLKISTYDGTGAHYNQFRINWDNLGTFASAPLISAWKDNTLPAASPGTQPNPLVGGDGTSVVNGQTTDTSNTSYLKAAVFGNGVTAAGAADNPSGNMGSTPTATSHASGGGLATVNATWTAWQDLQAATNWIVNGAIPKTLTAGTWNFLLALFSGPNQTGGTLVPVVGFSYTWV